MPPELVDRFWHEACTHSGPESARAIYLHFPFCKKRCTFCPFFINRYSKQALNDYVSALVDEIALTAASPGMDRKPVRAVYFGGGTPSDLPPEAVALIITTLRRAFPLAKDCEITMEGRIFGSSGALAAQWVNAGINRISLGVQTFDTRLRKLLGRIEPRERVLEVLSELTAVPGVTVNIDLLYGLPGQDEAPFLEEVETVLATGLHGFDLYHLKSFPGSELNRAITDGELPKIASLREKARLYQAASERLTRSSFRQITTCHWVRDERERSLYNQLAKNGSEIIPLGSGAGGRLDTHSFFQTPVLKRYLQDVAAGRKPLAFGGPRRPGEYLRDRLCDELEHGYLTTHSCQRAIEASPATAKHLGRWYTAELLAPGRRPMAYELTTAGRFWSATMLDHLCRHLGVTGHGI